MRMSTLLEEVRKFSVDEAVSPAQQAAIAISKKERGEKPKKEEVQEDGHTDVASAQNNVKVAMSALTKMSGELAKLNPEDALPSWWTNKVAVAVDKLDGMADYLDTQVEALDKEDEPKVKEIIKKLKKASDAHAGQSKDLEKAVKEEVELTEREDTAAAVARALKKMGVKYNRQKEDDIIKKIPKVLDSMNLSSGAKKMLLRDRDFIADVLGDLGEEVELDENASRAFDDLIKTGGIDKKDFQKAKQLYMKKDLMGLRKFIYNLDTDPLESIMDIISTNDSKAFMKMYPKSKKGEYMSSIAHTHKEEVDLVSTATEILTTANTYEEK